MVVVSVSAFRTEGRVFEPPGCEVYVRDADLICIVFVFIEEK
jgi:hypothetical protein